MRILMVSKACVVGQYQTKLEELAKFSDLELTVAVPPFWRDERGIMPLERSHVRGYKLIVTPMRFNGNFHLHYYPELPDLIQELQPQIVHIDEEPYNYATFHLMRAAKRVNAKTLFFTWQNILRRYPPPFSILESYALKHAHYTIAGNAEAADVLRAKHFRGPIRVIPQFGIDPNDFYPSREKKNDGTFRIGFFGRLVEEKGVQILLQGVSTLKGNWELHIFGSGPKKSQLQALARKLGIESRVKWDLLRSSSQVPDAYRTLDVLVAPSLTRRNWKEQFGRVLIEAMACEVPVIGSDSGEIPNVVGDAGIIFPEGNAEALRKQLEELMRNPARRSELGARGRDRVLENFTQARVAAETYAVYQEVLGS